MKMHAVLAAVLFLAGCAGQNAGLSSGAGGTAGTRASGGGDRALNTDVSDAVSRGSTRGYSPSSPSSGR